MQKPKLPDQVRNLIRMRRLDHQTERVFIIYIREHFAPEYIFPRLTGSLPRTGSSSWAKPLNEQNLSAKLRTSHQLLHVPSRNARAPGHLLHVLKRTLRILRQTPRVPDHLLSLPKRISHVPKRIARDIKRKRRVQKHPVRKRDLRITRHSLRDKTDHLRKSDLLNHWWD